jgi:hypothetical protein
LKKLLITLIIVFTVQSLFVGVAGAKYYKNNDETISINTGLNLDVPYNTGETSFELQESTHDALTSTTGLEVDHYYFWLEVDGQKILGVDPAAAMY